MKNSWFELMLNFFEKTITHLKEQYEADKTLADEGRQLIESEEISELLPKIVRVQVEQINSPQQGSLRVFTPSEQVKLTKASHQFLVRMASWGIVSSETLELIINRLIFSNSRIVSLQETKWTIRNTLSNGLDFNQVAFLDLILYQKEDRLSLH